MEHLRLLGLNPYWLDLTLNFLTKDLYIYSLNPYWLDLTSICSRRIINEEYGLNPYWLDLTELIINLVVT